MLADLPIIPVVQAVDWYQYDDSSLTGWPTPGNPYAQPAAYAYPDMEQVLLHLQGEVTGVRARGPDPGHAAPPARDDPG